MSVKTVFPKLLELFLFKNIEKEALVFVTWFKVLNLELLEILIFSIMASEGEPIKILSIILV